MAIIEYTNNSDGRRTPDTHANTARHLRAVWTAVPNMADAVSEYESLGICQDASWPTAAGSWSRGLSLGCMNENGRPPTGLSPMFLAECLRQVRAGEDEVIEDAESPRLWLQ